jgi:hypothetical protein
MATICSIQRAWEQGYQSTGTITYGTHEQVMERYASHSVALIEGAFIRGSGFEYLLMTKPTEFTQNYWMLFSFEHPGYWNAQKKQWELDPQCATRYPVMDDAISLPNDGVWVCSSKHSPFLLQLQRDGITSYCQQVCGGGQCGIKGRVCQMGINSETEMPVDMQ